MTEDVPTLQDQEAEGQFWEEVEKIVDGVISDVSSGHTVGKVAACEQGDAAAVLSAHATDFDLAINAIKYGCPEHLKPLVLKLARMVLLGNVRLTMRASPVYAAQPVE
jgi:hypothetical protein